MTIARQDRNTDNWYLGSITDEVGRTLATPLFFLDPGRNALPRSNRDGNAARWKDNPLAIDITKVLVDNATTLSLRLDPAAGGVRSRPAMDEDVGEPRSRGIEDK